MLNISTSYYIHFKFLYKITNNVLNKLTDEY